MSHDGDSRRNIGGPGILPLRSHHFDIRGDTIEMRTSVLAYMQAQTTPPSDGGLSIPALLSMGDLNGGMLWRKPLAQGAGSRQISMWRFIYPCMLGDPEEEPGPNQPRGPGIDLGLPNPAGGIGLGGGGGARKALNPLKPRQKRNGAGLPDGGGAVAEVQPHQHQREPTRVLAPRGNCPPIPDLDWFAVEKVDGAFRYQLDRRLEAKSMFVPQGALGRQWPLFPKDYLCMAVPANLEREQQDLVFPVDPRRIAVHAFEADPQIGSLTCEMEIADAAVIRDDACLPEQAWRKIGIGPMDGPCARHFPRGPQAMFTINDSGCRDVRGGWMWDNPSGLNVQGWKTPVAGHISGEYGGPLNTGPPGDPHALGGLGSDGPPITSLNPMHMNGNCIWRFGDYEYAKSVDANGNDNGKGNGSGDGPWNHDGRLDHLRDDRLPNRIRVDYVFNSALVHEHPCVRGVELHGRHHWVAWIDHGDSYRPPYDPGRQTPPGQPPGGSGVDVDPGGDPFGDVDPGGYARAPYPYYQDPQGGGAGASIGQRFPMVRDQGHLRSPRVFVESMREGAYPGLLARPQHFESTSKDFRNYRTPPDEDILAEKLKKPITGRLEAFGAQTGGTWDYTNQPNGTGRYAPLGTADGGWVVLPPEVSLEQARDGTEPTTTSDTYLVFHSETRLGFGKPDTTHGKVNTGFSINYDADNDLLHIYRESVSGATHSRTRLVTIEADGDVEIAAAGKGIIVQDTTDGNSYRINTTNGNFNSTAV